MRAFSWMIGPDIVSALSLYCYHSSIQTNIVTRFWWFFSANSSFFTFLNMSGSLLITRFHRQTVNCIDALAFTFYFLITYGVCKKRKYCFISSYFSLHDKHCFFIFSDITSSVKNIRNYVGTAAFPATRRSARRLQRLCPFRVSLEKYLATNSHSFTRPPYLALPEVLLTLVRGLFQMNEIQHCLIIFSTNKTFLQDFVLSYIAAH